MFFLPPPLLPRYSRPLSPSPDLMTLTTSNLSPYIHFHTLSRAPNILFSILWPYCPLSLPYSSLIALITFYSIDLTYFVIVCLLYLNVNFVKREKFCLFCALLTCRTYHIIPLLKTLQSLPLALIVSKF